MSLEKNIQNWVILDNKQKILSEQLKSIRDKKNEITCTITDYYISNNITAPTIKISDGKLNLTEMKVANILSYKFLEDCFDEYFENSEKSKELLAFIKNKRSYTVTNTIKRLYNK